MRAAHGSLLGTVNTAVDTYALEARDITKSFGSICVLAGSCLTVKPGKTVALLGPSGCGKTTLLRTLAGLETPDSGAVVVAGRTVSDTNTFVPPEKRNIGLVFQDWALFPHMSVAKNVGYGLTAAERSSGRVAETLAMVDLEALADRMPAKLSGGQQQRVALARALAPRPDVLLLDEPFSNLDHDLRIRVRGDVRRLLQELGTSAIFVTHDQEEAFVLGDEVAVMHEGVIEQQATPSVLYDAPASAWVAAFVGEANLVGGRIDGTRADTVVGPVPVAMVDAPNGEISNATVLLRPEYLMLGNGDEGTVQDVEFYGHDTAYRIVVGETRFLVRAMAAPRFSLGDSVSITYSGPPAAVFPRNGE
jgi:iron(III) transport system ATP-binding protein